MSRTIWIVLLASSLWTGCGDDDAASASPDSATPGLDSGNAGASGMAAVGGELPVSGMAGVPVAGSGGTAGAGPSCTEPGPMCNCVACAAPISLGLPPGACFDCGRGCRCPSGTPARPQPWEPPFDDVGTVGWRDSTEPFCGANDQMLAFDVFSDSRGVFVLASGIGFSLFAPSADEDAGVPEPQAGAGPDAGMNGMSDYALRTEIWQNDGTGWRVYAQRRNLGGDFALGGADKSQLFMHERSQQPPPQMQGMGELSSIACSIGTVRLGAIECLGLDPVQSLFVAGADLAYAVMGDTRLLVYEGERWRGHTVLLPYPATSVWGDGTSVLATGEAGTMFWLEQDAWRLEDPGTLHDITSLWGAARNDIWAGTSRGGVLHYDGVGWTPIGEIGGGTCNIRLPITGIWGADGTVFFHNRSQLARWNGSELESLADWSCKDDQAAAEVQITGLSGTSPNEVFLTIVDPLRFAVGVCGPMFVVHFDGTSFHRM